VENPAFHRIRESFDQAFWDSLVDDLRLATPRYVRVLRALAEIRDGINDMAGSREAGSMAEAVDLDFIKQQAEAGLFTWDSCRRLVGSVVEVVQRVQAPKRDEETKRWWEQIDQEMQDASAEEQPLAFSKALEFLLNRVDAMRIDAARARLRAGLNQVFHRIRESDIAGSEEAAAGSISEAVDDTKLKLSTPTCRGIKHALTALYRAEEHLPPEDSKLAIRSRFRTQIERLRSKLQQIAGSDALSQFDEQRRAASGEVASGANGENSIGQIQGVSCGAGELGGSGEVRSGGAAGAYSAKQGRMTNEQLAHELLLDPTFQLDESCRCSVENPSESGEGLSAGGAAAMAASRSRAGAAGSGDGSEPGDGKRDSDGSSGGGRGQQPLPCCDGCESAQLADNCSICLTRLGGDGLDHRHGGRRKRRRDGEAALASCPRCMQAFHAACLEQSWHYGHDRCPLCRHSWLASGLATVDRISGPAGVAVGRSGIVP
jgi:hypothetical protein